MPTGSPGPRYALGCLRNAVVPPVIISPPPHGVRFERDLPVHVRDDTVLRVNVFRPSAEGRYPVIMSAHPYGKDRFPRRWPLIGYQPAVTYRIMRQSAPVRFSAWTTWEAPDPAFAAASMTRVCSSP